MNTYLDGLILVNQLTRYHEFPTSISSMFKHTVTQRPWTWEMEFETYQHWLNLLCVDFY